MTIQLDAPPVMWKITCDATGCPNRLYVSGADEHAAAKRAEFLFGWSFADGDLCRTHRRPK